MKAMYMDAVKVGFKESEYPQFIKDYLEHKK